MCPQCVLKDKRSSTSLCLQGVADESACRPGSVSGHLAVIPMCGHPSWLVITDELMRSTRELGRAVLKRFPIWPCSVRGFACHLPYSRRGALLPHLFTLTLGQSKGRYLFCGTFPEVAPAGHYPAPFLHGARTFLPSCDARPSDRLAFVLVTRLRNDFTQIQLPKLAITIVAFAQ